MHLLSDMSLGIVPSVAKKSQNLIKTSHTGTLLSMWNQLSCSDLWTQMQANRKPVEEDQNLTLNMTSGVLITNDTQVACEELGKNITKIE